MTKSDQLNTPASLGPFALHALGQSFEEAWQEIAGNFSGDEVEAARTRLAKIMLDLVSDEPLFPAQLKHTAISLMDSPA